jgi:CBS domain-containing protein
MKALVHHGPGQRSWDTVDDPTIFATHRFALDDTMSAYDTFAEAASTNALKVVLEGSARDASSNGHIATNLVAGPACEPGSRHNHRETQMSISTEPGAGGEPMPSMESATVSDAMHQGIIACDPDATRTEVAKLMAGHRVHCVVVLSPAHDKPQESLAWGIISDLDVLKAGTSDGRKQTARDLAAQPVITVKPPMPLHEAAELMVAYSVSHLVVVDPERQQPVGVLSTIDIVAAIARAKA